MTRSPSAFAGLIDWADVRRRIHDHSWAADLFSELQKGVDEALSKFPEEPPRLQSEWTHHYYCDKCGGHLTFDPGLPRDHVCPVCNINYVEPIRDGAWRTKMHNARMEVCRNAAMVARVVEDREAYVEYIRKTMLFYGQFYRDYPVHGVRAGKGKVLPQSLDEAIWLINAGDVMFWEDSWFTPEERTVIAEGLFRPAADLLKPQISKIHNIHVWLNAGVATAAFVMNDKELLNWTINGEFGWKNQLAAGVRDDGMWWENSMGYHFYSFHAFQSLALVAARNGNNLWDHFKFRQLLSAPLELTYPDGHLPAHNDSWRPKIASASKYYELGSEIWPGEGFDAALAWFYQLGAHPPIEAMLYRSHELPAPRKAPTGSRLFPASGIGILENDKVRICLKSGPHGGGHDHRDKLNLEVTTANGWSSEDLGTSGYAAEITQRWLKQPAAHNVVVLHASRQLDGDAFMSIFSTTRMSGRMEKAYDGVSMSRTIELTERGWKDRFEVEGTEPDQIDWCFHGTGILEADFPMQKIESAGVEGGFDWLRDVTCSRTPSRLEGAEHLRAGSGAATEVHSAKIDTAWCVRWKLASGAIQLRFAASPGTQILFGKGDDYPPTQDLGVVIVRRHAAVTVFEAEFEIL